MRTSRPSMLALLLLVASPAWGNEDAPVPPKTAQAGTATDMHQTEVQGSDGARLQTQHGDIALHGWAEGGVEAATVHNTPLNQTRYGATLTLARLSATYQNPRGFATRLQFDASKENVRLLDAVARLGPKHKASLQVGRFKVPLSGEVLVPATQLVMPTRMLLTGMAPSRAVGVLGTAPWSPGLGDHHTYRGSFSVGAFDPVGSGAQVGAGSVLVASLDQGLAHIGEVHLAVHLAASTWLHPDDVATTLGEDTPDRDQWADVALAAEGAGWTLAVEGLTSHRRENTDRQDTGWDLGAGALIAKRLSIPAGQGFELEPALAWDSMRVDNVDLHRSSVAMNLHHDDWHVVDTLAYDVTFEPSAGEAVHVLRATLQVGF